MWLCWFWGVWMNNNGLRGIRGVWSVHTPVVCLCSEWVLMTHEVECWLSVAQHILNLLIQSQPVGVPDSTALQLELKSTDHQCPFRGVFVVRVCVWELCCLMSASSVAPLAVSTSWTWTNSAGTAALISRRIACETQSLLNSTPSIDYLFTSPSSRSCFWFMPDTERVCWTDKDTWRMCSRSPVWTKTRFSSGKKTASKPFLVPLLGWDWVSMESSLEQDGWLHSG